MWLGVAAAVLCLAGPVIAGKMGVSPFASVTGPSLGQLAGERLLIFLGKVSGLNVAAKVLLVLSATLPFVLLFGMAYSTLTSTELKASCIKFYALLNRLPGAAVLNEKTTAAAVLVNASYFFGLFVFAVVLGVVTDEIKTTFKDIKNGRYPVSQEGHIVVLNWNNQSVPLLRQLAAARKAGLKEVYNRPIAVLSEVSKAEMDSTIRSRLKGLDLEVYTRQGSPTVPGDLATIAASKAAAIIVLNPAGSASPAQASAAVQAQSAVALAAASPGLASQRVVFQAPAVNRGMAKDHMAAFKRLTNVGSSMQTMQFSDADLLTRITTVSALQPGMQRVVMTLLGPDNACLRAQPAPASLVGTEYRHARRMFADGVVCGLMRGEVTDLLVPEKHVIQADEKLVIMASAPDVGMDAAAERNFLLASEGVEGRLARSHNYKQGPEHIIIVSLEPEKAVSLADVFAELSPRGSSVTFLLPKMPAAGVPARKGNVSFKFLTPDSASENCVSAALLKEAGIQTANCVVVGGLDSMASPGDADAFVTATVLQVQDSVRLSGRKTAPHIVSQVRKKSTEQSINTYLKVLKEEAKASGASSGHIITRPDLFVFDDMVATMLAMSAAHPKYLDMVQEMLDSEGAELYLRNPQVYNLGIGDLLTFADVAETTRVFGETAVGVMRADGNFTLAPEPTFPLNLQQGDKVIVLAQNFDVTKLKRN